jgi:predicted alpha/beta superfamily hydrolase
MRRLLAVLVFLLSFAVSSSAQSNDSIQVSRVIPSAIFGKDREITVSLPWGYYRNSSAKYPVAYVFDAQGDDMFNFAASLIHNLESTQSLEPMIVVGIKSENRQFEFTPRNKTDAPYKMWGKDARIGGADTLLASLRSEVFPYIEKNFRTLPVRLGLGHSLGGTFVTYALTRDDRTFDAIIAVSPNYDYDNQQLVERVKAYSGDKSSPAPFVYLAHGNTDRYETLFAVGIKKVVATLQARKPSDVQLVYEPLKVNKHGNTFMTGYVSGLQAYHNSIYSKAETTIGYFGNLSAKYGYTLNADQINQIAYNYFMTPDMYPQAIKIFDWGIKLHPDVANLYDSKSEAEENMGETRAAIASDLKALSTLEAQKGRLNQKDYDDAKKYFSERVEKLRLNPSMKH